MFEKERYRGVLCEVVELVDFVTFPSNVSDIRSLSCVGYGKRYSERAEVIKQKGRDGIYYEEASTKLAKKKRGNSQNSFRDAQDTLEGVSNSGNKNLTLFNLCIRGKLNGNDGDGEEYFDRERKFLVTYDFENNILLECKEFVYRIDNYALFQIDGRTNRLIGRSIPRKSRDINDVVDTVYNQRINSRTIAMVPTFKALKSKKRDLDPMLEEKKWGPGRIWWVDDFNSIDQWRIQPTDLGESIGEEGNARNILDLYLGSAASLMSGRPPEGDKDAPGNKTQALIGQTNLRMESPLEYFREGVDQLGEICLALFYQFGPPILEFLSQTPDGKPVKKSLHKKILRSGIKLKMSGITVRQNPDAELMKGLQIHQILMGEPAFQQSMKLRVESLRAALREGRVKDRDKKLPTAEEIQQMEVELRKQAMIQLQAEQAQAQKEAEENQVKENLAKVRQKLAIENTARKAVEQNFGGENGAVAREE